MAESGKGETVRSVLDTPSCLHGREIDRDAASPFFKPQKSWKEFTVYYDYTQLDGDDPRFELLEADPPEKGIYARFMVKRSDSNKKAHVLWFSHLIPLAKDEIQVAKQEVENDHYKVVLEIKSKMDVKMEEFFKSKRLSSSDEEKT